MNDIKYDPSDVISDLISHIRLCNHEIEQFNIDKQKSEQQLKILLEHQKEGAGTYQHKNYKITVTTGRNFSLDKDKYADYLMGLDRIDSRYTIAKQITKFELNIKAIKTLELYGTQKDRELMNSFISSSEKKLHVSIKELHDEIIGDVVNVNDDVCM